MAFTVTIPTDGALSFTGAVAAIPCNPDGTIGAAGVLASAGFTRPSDTNAYSIGDLVANSVTAGSVVPLAVALGQVQASAIRITGARLLMTGTVLTNASFRVHLYTSAPVASNGDNAAWLTTLAGYVGRIDVDLQAAGTGVVFTTGAQGFTYPATPIIAQLAAASVTIYALIEARAAYTPISAEVFTLTLQTS